MIERRRLMAIEDEEEERDCSNEYLTFVSLEDNNTINGLIKLVDGTDTGDNIITVYYSTNNGQTWDSATVRAEQTVTLATINKGDKILFKAVTYNNNNTYAYKWPFRFTSQKNVKVEGNIMSMLYGDNFIGQTSIPISSAFAYLLSNSHIVEARNLVLPATTLSPNCYDHLLSTANIKKLPHLPATTLAESCYYGMFYMCLNLEKIPADYLPATNLAAYCYRAMFAYCIKLKVVPATLLPATTLVDSCYWVMFQGCTSLTTAPELPATTLVKTCYSNMFNSCTALNYIKCLATDISAFNCTTNWVNGVASSGTFIKPSSMSSWTSGNNGIPTNWDV